MGAWHPHTRNMCVHVCETHTHRHLDLHRFPRLNRAVYRAATKSENWSVRHTKFDLSGQEFVFITIDYYNSYRCCYYRGKERVIIGLN